MMRALRYEPQGQRQRFEPREWQDREEQHKHIHLHLHLHLHLSFRVREGRSWHLSAFSLVKIFATLVGAMYIVFALLFPLADQGVPTSPLYSIAWQIMIASLALAWGAVVLGGLPLLVSAWRSTPRVRFLLIFPFIPLLLIILQFLFPSFPLIPSGELNWLLNGVLILAQVISIGLLIGISRRAAIADRWLRFASLLSFVTVAAMVLLLLGGLLIASLINWLVPFLVVCIVVIAVGYPLFRQPHSRGRSQARPKDDSPYLEP